MAERLPSGFPPPLAPPHKGEGNSAWRLGRWCRMKKRAGILISGWGSNSCAFLLFRAAARAGASQVRARAHAR